MTKKPSSFNIQKWYPRILLAAAIVGFAASFTLTLEKFAILKNPNHQLTCSINPLLSCGPIITSDEASAFGFPNTLIGIFAFSVLIAVAVNMLAGATVKKEKKWYWKTFVAVHVFGLGFVAWLMREALYELKALCIYCMVAWAVTIVLNWYGFLWLSSTGRLGASSKVAKIRDWGLKNHWGVVLLAYLLVFCLIFVQFRDYFHSVWF
jgi:uncharacterized membrane protein